MNEEIDEYEIYHQDFTTASDWEILIARLEEIIIEWNLSKSKVSKCCNENIKKWSTKSEDIKFRGQNYILSYHAIEPLEAFDDVTKSNEQFYFINIQEGLWDSSQKFLDDTDGSPHPVSNWFGLKQYLILCPKNPLVDGSLIKIIMSSVNIAFANVNCAVPLFVKIREHWQQIYLGIYEDNNHKMSFDTIHLKRISNQSSHLSGLVGLFKSKISSPFPLDAVTISAKFSYEMKDSDAFAWKMKTHCNEFLSIDGFDVKELTKLPFGSENNPIQSALLNAIWPRFKECALVDSSTYSDIDPMMAPTWTISLKLKSNINCQLSEIVGRIMNLLDNHSLLMDVLGLSKSLGLVNPLNKITEAPITISKLVRAAVGRNTNITEFKGPITDDLLMPLLYYVFPDAVDDNNFPYPEELEGECKQDSYLKIKHTGEGVPDTVVYLDNTLMISQLSHFGISYHVWADQLGHCPKKYCCEISEADTKICSYVKASPQSGLVWRFSVTLARLVEAGGIPYLAHFWYEFVQELQYRWEHRILVPGVMKGVPNARTCLLHQKLQLLNCCIIRAQEGPGTQQGNSSEDEFYDCSENEVAEDLLPWDRPVGRLNRLENATLRNGSPLYVPFTQDPAPKTEDQLEEDAELMVRLGDDAKASELRAKMMSASLLSDMEAFKAANPGAELCDFVLWYSPRDWKPDDGGCLGERMLLPGNPWVEAWNVARPVPAARQRRLFDETREAERVLHFLRSRSVGAVAELILPAILKAGAVRAMSEGAPCTSSSVGGVDKRRTLEIAARELFESEKEACRVICARKVLGDSVEGKPLDVAGRSRVISAMGGTLSSPFRREFTLRVKDEVGPQLMRAALSNDMLIVGAFTERIVVL